MQSRTRRAALGLLALAATLSGAAIFAASADAYIYWSNLVSIGRAANDGSGAVANFIPRNNDSSPICGVAVHDDYIYWSTLEGDIGRAGIDGTNPDPDWIDRTGQQSSCGLAVDDSGVYVADGWGTGGGAIRVSNLAGSGFTDILPAHAPCGLAVAGGDVFWQQGGAPGTLYKSSIATPGTELVPISGNDGGYCSLAAGAGFLFYNSYPFAFTGSTPISRTAGDGSPSVVLTGGARQPDDACGLAYSAGQVYWKEYNSGSIGRVAFDGSTPPQFDLVSGATVGEGCGIAADELPAPNTEITSGPTGSTPDATPTFAFRGTPAADTDHLECGIDGGGFTACTSPFTAASLSDGQHTIRVRAVDAAGNADASPATRGFAVTAAACRAAQAKLAGAKEAVLANQAKVDKAEKKVKASKGKAKKRAKKKLKQAEADLKASRSAVTKAQAAVDDSC